MLGDIEPAKESVYVVPCRTIMITGVLEVEQAKLSP